MRATLATPHGRADIRSESPQLVSVTADSDCAGYLAQGYAAARLRLWQLDLTRRVAGGRLSAIFGKKTLRSDRFQRSLGLGRLAAREARRDAGSAQAAHVEAYVAGMNRALDETRILPVEFQLLRYRPERFTVEDVYLVAELKYFINAAWQFEVLRTLVAERLPGRCAAQLFSVFSLEGPVIDPLPHGLAGELAGELAALVEAGAAGLRKLGVSSPDIGSNAFAVAGARTRSGFPLLATDPHMGQVNPGYSMFFKLQTGEGLSVFGSHFPGAPGVVVGRTPRCGWGMVGLMAANQDLLWGRLDATGTRVSIAGEWTPLVREESLIEIRGADPEVHEARGFASGQLIHAKDGHALFLRWPALDSPIGGVSLNELSRAVDWPTYRHGLARMTNSPQISVYADDQGNIGLQTVGLIPRRRSRRTGAFVGALDDPATTWDGYFAFDELPSCLNPPAGWILHANEYAQAHFAGGPHIASRWHPPTRARRIAQRIEATPRHDHHSLAGIQDDTVDLYARDALPFLLALVDDRRPLLTWDGDTRHAAPALVFERWIALITDAVLAGRLPPALRSRYPDLWPAHRWNVLEILRNHASDWEIPDVRALVTTALDQARKDTPSRAWVDFRHTLRRHPIGRLLFSARYRYAGGSRETIHALRRNTDFLTTTQSGPRRKRDSTPYTFGPSFKLIYDFSPTGYVWYLANTPASGNPLGVVLAPTLHRWRRARRYRTSLT